MFSSGVPAFFSSNPEYKVHPLISNLNLTKIKGEVTNIQILEGITENWRKQAECFRSAQ